MVRANAPVVIVPTPEAERCLGNHLPEAARLAWRAIAASGMGLEIDHLQFVAAGMRLALHSRLRADGIIELALRLVDPRKPAGPIGRGGRGQPAAGLRKPRSQPSSA